MAVRPRCGTRRSLGMVCALPGQPDIPLTILGNLDGGAGSPGTVGARQLGGGCAAPFLLVALVCFRPQRLRGAAFALITKMLGHYTEALWGLFQSSTLLTVGALLRLCGRVVTTGPAKAQIGTSTFSVTVAAGCSGLEGLGVMVAFLAICFWAYRRDLRFPQVLLLVPVGLALEWFLNSVRIAVLILLGSRNQGAAVNGFHSTAGWLLVSFVAYGLVAASWRIPAFTRIGSESKVLEPANPVGVYLVPLLAIIATAMLTKIFHSGFDLLYPLRVLAAAGALYLYWRELAAIGWGASLWSVALGLLVFAMWIALAPSNDASANAIFATGISGLSTG